MRLAGNNKRVQGFTLIEMMVALMITVMISTAIMALGAAMSGAFEASQDDSYDMANLRRFMVDFDDSVRSSRLICSVSSSCIILWGRDDNDDGEINPFELIIYNYDSDGDCLKKCKIAKTGVFAIAAVKISDIKSGSFLDDVNNNCVVNEFAILNDCDSFAFKSDKAAPRTRYLSSIFKLALRSGRMEYEVSSHLQSNPEYYLTNLNEALLRDE